MTITSTSYSNEMYQQMQQMQKKQPPSAADLAAKVLENSDTNGDSLISINEISLDEDIFTSLDSDGDGSLSSSELETSISSQLENMKNKTGTPEEFGEFLSSLGLEVPPPPPRGPEGHAAKMASDIFSSTDSDADGLLSLEEMGIDETLFNSMDSDEDGQISQEELTNKFTSLFEELKNGTIDSTEFEETMTALGAELPPPPAGGMAGGGAPMGGGGSSSEEEQYEDADTNQDGTVSSAEYLAYYGSASEEDINQYTLDLVSTLIEAVKKESKSEDEDLSLSQFKGIMKMVNDQIQDPNTASILNQYVSNISDKQSA